MSTAMVFGVTGQDGTYLTEVLPEKGYDVVGVTRDVGKARRICRRIWWQR